MESMGKKKPRRPRRSFTPESKAEIVGLCRRGDRSVRQVAKDFELTETAVRDWVKQAFLHARRRDCRPNHSSGWKSFHVSKDLH
ncbi:transposase [Streptomyces sp. NBC_01102]|uniref:transposase n=1 Tax=Streptomyces sp. NBC_01102 TaxID=2903749 RepID=UPI00386EA3AA|nr:transposase [Streptomyces sp. NBC_01102]